MVPSFQILYIHVIAIMHITYSSHLSLIYHPNTWSMIFSKFTAKLWKRTKIKTEECEFEEVIGCVGCIIIEGKMHVAVQRRVVHSEHDIVHQ